MGLNITLERDIGKDLQYPFMEQKRENVRGKGLAPELNHQIKYVFPSLRHFDIIISKHVEET